MQKIIARCTLLLLFVLLSACTSFNSGQDGPPAFNVDVSRIPNAVPRVEPESRYGNPPVYVVDGRRYYVLKTSAGYDERGIASWYGTKFHDRRTSSGEPYDMFAMTAASCVLPLPTYVKVTNLQNGLWVIVKVNDRGPFDANRIMDLSYVAAKKLGVLAHGTAYVEVRAINPATWDSWSNTDRSWTTSETAAPLAHTPIIYLQVGAFSDYANAESLRQRVSNLTSTQVQIVTSQAPYKVQIGPIWSVSRSDDITRELEQAGFGTPMTVIR